MKRINNNFDSIAQQTTAQTSTSSSSFLAGAVKTPAAPADAGTNGEAPVLLCNGVALQVVKFHLHEKLADCVDSMLFDSATNIASITAQTPDGRFFVAVDLMVRGSVSVTYKGKTYHKPSEFPQELKDRIRKFPGTWTYISEEDLMEAFDENTLDELAEMFDPDLDDEDDLCVSCNNWFEYLYTVKDGEDSHEDGICCWENLANMDSFGLQAAMLTVAKEAVDMQLGKTECFEY